MDHNNTNKIGAKGIPVQCAASTPALLTIDNLQQQLNRIGLTCEWTRPERLERLKREVERKLQTGENQSFAIYHLKPEYVTFPSISPSEMKNDYNVPFAAVNARISSTWEPSSNDTMGYIQKLSVILAKNNFDRIKQHFTDFTGYDTGEQTSTSTASTVEAILDFFVKTLNTACSAVVNGINLDDLKAICTNMFPSNISMEQDYNESNSFLIHLLQDYNDEKKEAVGVGAIYLSWSLLVTNYKNKKESIHSSTLKLCARSVMYDDADVIDTHYKFVANMITNTNNEKYEIPTVTRQIPIFDQLPVVTYDTFNQGIPETASANQSKSIILYQPDLVHISTINNTGSSAEVSYDISIAKGFSNSSSISFGEKLNVEADCEFVKMGVKFNFNLSFNSESSFSTTETISYTIPAGKKTYLYQERVLYAVLVMDMETGKLRYMDKGKYDSPIIIARDTPLEG